MKALKQDNIRKVRCTSTQCRCFEFEMNTTLLYFNAKFLLMNTLLCSSPSALYIQKTNVLFIGPMSGGAPWWCPINMGDLV